MALPQVAYPAALPISARKDEIIAAIRRHQVVIIAGETGSGKTTQIPKMCLEAGLGIDGRIGCTQPRRMAALSIARRVAEELGVVFGRQVGSKIRFADQSSQETLVKFMTDGILLAETQGDRELREYEAIIIDEAHERSLNIDFLLGHLKLLLRRRPELKLIITSATINTKAFSQAFDNAPIIEVSGRMFPVEVRYEPLDEAAADQGDLTYIDAAANLVERILLESEFGDILVFMPGERDIRETRDLIQGRVGSGADLIPLFGRLSYSDQQRVFAPSGRRKIVIATNIAETSLTIPGIRFVIDAGLARISRYSPRTRTKRLPIEPISQSSANQRKGRAGRIESGVCVRLYSEQDLLARPEQTQPEIQRANLAEVILRMKAFHLGDIETFPFLDCPSPAAINSGYQLLEELGVLDAERNLTPLGRDLARLPVDPTVGRMLLQAQREGCVEELLVIAAGLSIQDPRERPVDARQAADQAQKKFEHPQSDFLTLLNIWTAFHDQLEALKTQNQMRKFCKSHFVSYQRMREWIDLHSQLEETLDELSEPRKCDSNPRFLDALNCGNQEIHNAATAHVQAKAPPARPSPRTSHDPHTHKGGLQLYEAIHRSILTGLLSQIAQRQERNIYQAPANRELMIFPGSGLFARTPALTKKGDRAGKAQSQAKGSAAKQPEWIVAGEIVETSRLYARTVAGVQADWIAELGRHLCRVTYDNPHWDSNVGKVLARERLFLRGLELTDRSVFYGNINPGEATEIFIRSALVEEEINAKHAFLDHNRQLRQKIETWLTRLRLGDLPDLDQAFFEFYRKRLENISSTQELNRFVNDRTRSEPHFLCATEEEITGSRNVSFDARAFPDSLQVGPRKLPIRYAYAPGEEDDGVTLKLPVEVARTIEPAQLQWVVPAFRQAQAAELLRGLPKSLRVPLMPLAPKAAEIGSILGQLGDLAALSKFVREKYGVEIAPAAWNLNALPNHLRPRFEITGKDGQVLAAGRDLVALSEQLKREESNARVSAEQNGWTGAAAKWERYGLTTWSFGDVPQEVEITTVQGLPIFGYPGLQVDDGGVSLRLFRKCDAAEAATMRGFERLCEFALQKELAWLQRDLKALDQFKDLYVTLGAGEELRETAYANLKRHLFETVPVLPLAERRFHNAIAQGRARLPGLALRFAARVGDVLKMRQQILLLRKPYPGMRVDLDFLLPKRFLEKTPFERLEHLARYLKAMLIRAERAVLNPSKDQEKTRLVLPFAEELRRQMSRADLGPSEGKRVAEFRWMLEEFKVSVFAQELGTAQPVSAKRLREHLEQMKGTPGARR